MSRHVEHMGEEEEIAEHARETLTMPPLVLIQWHTIDDEFARAWREQRGEQ